MVGFWRQMRLLLWKGVLVKSRQKFWLTVELLVPLVLFIILAFVRTRDFNDYGSQCHYDSKGFPSAGILPTLHSFLCSFSNNCHDSPTTGDEMQFIHNESSKNESILVDLLYYSSLQLEYIGRDPAEFSQLLAVFTRLVKALARLDNAEIDLPILNDFFESVIDVEEILVEMGVTRNASRALKYSRLTPNFFPELFTYISKIRDTEVIFLPFALVEPVPLLCNETIFNDSFVLPPNTTLTAEDRNSLCNVTAADLVSLNYTEALVSLEAMSLSNFTSLNQGTIQLARPLAVFGALIQRQPLFTGFFMKWSSILPLSFENVTAALFCGENPFDTTTEGLTPASKKVKTAFDTLRKNLIDFIDNVVPGKQEHDKKFCNDVWVHNDLNCSALDTAVMQRLRPLFTGYILVTPPSPVVKRMVDVLNNPLRIVDFLRQELFQYPEIADVLQEALYGSDLRAASLNLRTLLQRMSPGMPIPPKTLESIEFVLEHIFAPSTDPYSFGAVTKNITEILNHYTTCFLLDRFVMVANETSMEETATCLSNYQQYFSGIVFVNMTDNATEFDRVTTYKIRHLPTMVDNTYSYEDRSSRVLDRNKPFNDLKYLTYGFSFLQEAVERAIIGIRANSTRTLGMYAQQEPYPCVAYDTFYVGNFYGLFVILSFIIPAALLVKNIVHEKELRLKEQMRIMGLGDMVHLWSWAIISVVLNLTSTVIIALIMKFGDLMKHADFSLILVFLMLFALSSVAMCLLLSTFFSNANISTAATCLAYFLFFFPFQLSKKANSRAFTICTLIFPQTTLGYGAAMLAVFADDGKATWKDIHSIYLPAYEVGLVECLVAFVVETFLFIILAWYKSAVSPGIYGVSLPWYFLVTKRYWLPSSRSCGAVDFNLSADDSPETVGDSFDGEPSDMSPTVRVVNMSKVYSNGTIALENLNLRLYEDQITALLGHNGAGKTTTMSILCGLYSPSSGTALVYGHDIRREIDRVREVLGVCPQYNVLFEFLTVAEQLKLFAALKGTPDEKIQNEVDDILLAVSLVDKANDLASTLSGGMKRRLCIGIAFVGGSRFVILDEPTAGVDVTSRREIWQLLQNNKKGRTILLSTHHMDEADILSDRIALLSEGHLISLGSSIFLKNKYGEAFYVHACKREPSLDYTATVTRIVTEAAIPIRLSDETDDELVFSIPISTDSLKLEKFFTFFDMKKAQYMIGEYGISAPTLQEIFVKLTPQKDFVVPKQRAGLLAKIKGGLRGAAVQSDEKALIKTVMSTMSEANGSDSTANGSGTATANNGASNPREVAPQIDLEDDLLPPLLSGWPLTVCHTKAILKSRWQYTIRSKKHILFEVLLPICLIFGCELYAKIQFSGPSSYVSSQPALPLIPEMYGNDTFSYVSLWDRDPQSLSYQLMKSMEESPNMGTRCVNEVPVFRRDLPESKLFWIMKKKPMQLSAGCDTTLGNGTFEWSANETEIDYNVDVNCMCIRSFWNCSAIDYPFYSVPGVVMNTTMRVFDMSYRNISQMRMMSRWITNDSLIQTPMLGGFSFGHTSLRAKNLSEVQTEIQGWHVLVAGMNQTAVALNVTMSNSTAPAIVDPFVANITASDFVAAVLRSMESQQNVKAWFNNKLYTSLPIFTSFLNNALLRIESVNLDPSDIGIIGISHPMNYTVSSTFDTMGRDKLIVFRIVLIMLVLCVIPAGFTVFLVEDRICDAFHLQLVSGLSRQTYWSTGYVFDMAVYVLSVVAILLIYVMFRVREFAYSFEAMLCFFLLFLLYGFCAVLWAYILQRRFDVPALSFVLISIGTFFVGIVASLTVIVIEQLMQQDPTLALPHAICSTVFLILPQYNLGMAIFRGSFVSQLIQIGEEFLRELNRLDLVSSLPLPSLLEWDLMGMHLACLVAHIFIALLVLFIVELEPFGFLRKWERIYTKKLMETAEEYSDDDVIAEKKRVDEMDDSSDNPLVVKGLAKAYSKKLLAVRNVSFAVDQGECFGLLGLNGAGKTTTFAILTQKIQPGFGSVQIHGRRMVIGDRSSFEQVGYCPQFDALNMKLTTTENMELFARIRGIPENHIQPLVSRLLVSLNLKPYSDTITSALSGGNRRKLSVAISLISHPSLVLLDEPSAGMDPGSQQFLWKVIDRLRKSGKAVVITSHSMEECEALCTRIAIMDRGQIRCIGSKQHLKSKFGEGHSLTVKMRSQSDARMAAKFVLDHLKGAKIESIHCSTIFLHIDVEQSNISDIYRVVNQLKNEFSVEDFSLSQSTLAEVFQSLSSHASSTSVSSGQTTSTAETDLTD